MSNQASSGYVEFQNQVSGHVVWGIEPGSSSECTNFGISVIAGAEQPEKGRRKLKNLKLYPKGIQIPPNAEILTPSEDPTSSASESLDSSEKIRRKLKNRKLYPNGLEIPPNVLILTPSEDLTSSQSLDSSSSTSTSTDDAKYRDCNYRGGEFRGLQEAPPNGNVVNFTPSDSSRTSNDCSVKSKSNTIVEQQDDATALPSIGSALHRQNKCRQCLFFHTEVGCHHGMSCEFCHMPHRDKSSTRPGKAKRERYRKLVQASKQREETPEGDSSQVYESNGERKDLQYRAQSVLVDL